MRELCFRRPWPGEKVSYVCTKCGHRFWVKLGLVELVRCPSAGRLPYRIRAFVTERDS